MRLVWTSHAWEDYLHWQANDKKMLKRVNQLLRDTLRDPFEGIGKPEPLKYGAEGAWSRRITQEHRLVYMIVDGDLVVLQARYHY
ncbi:MULTISPECIES: Txe/YoeB family addiction module toxin [Corynebacterium]|uniref:Txe/YoeB family addiction module toxin n=1 Tax=Corynebacterium TaxID=1716 RepID=UPI0008A38E3B|nr:MULTISPECIES: Txe/YoeB family addiction module toxin [Corynebacterium]MDK7179330.1 Txe/YoeB family addiction module toxin [Corynebacterium riegelii]OFT74127.1 toxin RelK [Corynebacterium sp. HMSC30G07]PLA13024.1 Txe/YoeB family addiction module toxin [Corynebacterium riegelii]QQU83785.1 Txe/YoeB family addiction module toxin [Corynebacterium riegelii]